MSTSPWDDALRRYSAREHTHDDIVTESAGSGEPGVAAAQRSENNAAAATGATLPSFDDIVHGDDSQHASVGSKTESLVVPSTLDGVFGGTDSEVGDVGDTGESGKASAPPAKRRALRRAITALAWLFVTSLVCGGLPDLSFIR